MTDSAALLTDMARTRAYAVEILAAIAPAEPAGKCNTVLHPDMARIIDGCRP